jgi:hypothetical protein
MLVSYKRLAVKMSADCYGSLFHFDSEAIDARLGIVSLPTLFARARHSSKSSGL